jgi:hypothetical protein
VSAVVPTPFRKLIMQLLVCRRGEQFRNIEGRGLTEESKPSPCVTVNLPSGYTVSTQCWTVSISNLDQGEVEQPISVMMCGAKCSENDHWTFGGSERTPGLEADATEVVEVVVVDEILT